VERQKSYFVWYRYFFKKRFLPFRKRAAAFFLIMKGLFLADGFHTPNTAGMGGAKRSFARWDAAALRDRQAPLGSLADSVIIAPLCEAKEKNSATNGKTLFFLC
jgi:hypothetical protein